MNHKLITGIIAAGLALTIFVGTSSANLFGNDFDYNLSSSSRSYRSDNQRWNTWSDYDRQYRYDRERDIDNARWRRESRESRYYSSHRRHNDWRYDSWRNRYDLDRYRRRNRWNDYSYRRRNRWDDYSYRRRYDSRRYRDHYRYRPRRRYDSRRYDYSRHYRDEYPNRDWKTDDYWGLPEPGFYDYLSGGSSYSRPVTTYRRTYTSYRPSYRPSYYSGEASMHSLGMADGVFHIFSGSRERDDREIIGGVMSTIGNGLLLSDVFN